MKKINQVGSCAKIFAYRGLIAYSLSIRDLRHIITERVIFTMRKQRVFYEKATSFLCESADFTSRKHRVYYQKRASFLSEANSGRIKISQICIFRLSDLCREVIFATFHSLEFIFSLRFFFASNGIYKCILNRINGSKC